MFGYFCNHADFKSLPNDKFLDWFKLKALPDDNMNATRKQIFLLGLVENTAGKGENAGNPLPHMAILGSSISASNKDMMSKIWTIGIQLSD